MDGQGCVMCQVNQYWEIGKSNLMGIGGHKAELSSNPGMGFGKSTKVECEQISELLIWY